MEFWAEKPDSSTFGETVGSCSLTAAGRVYTFRAFNSEKHLFEALLWKQKKIPGILHQAGI